MTNGIFDMRNLSRIAITCMMTFSLSAIAGDKQCNLIKCPAGSAVVTYSTKSEPYIACPTMELSNYTNHVLALLVTSKLLTNRMPNISPKTGEPEQSGKSKELIDAMRTMAKVSTFDQAMQMCKQGKSNIKASVMNNPEPGVSFWVIDSKTKQSFWMPKSAADLAE